MANVTSSQIYASGVNTDNICALNVFRLRLDEKTLASGGYRICKLRTIDNWINIVLLDLDPTFIFFTEDGFTGFERCYRVHASHLRQVHGLG